MRLGTASANVRQLATVLGAAAIIGGCLCAVASSDDVVYGQPQNGFAVSLIVASSSFQNGPHVYLTFWVKNTGPSKLYVSDAFAGRETLSVSKLDGTALFYDPNGDLSPPQSRPFVDPSQQTVRDQPPGLAGSSSNPGTETPRGGPKFYWLPPGQAKKNDKGIVDDLAIFGIVPGQTYRLWAVAEIYGYEKNPWNPRHLATVVSNTILVTAPTPPPAR